MLASAPGFRHAVTARLGGSAPSPAHAAVAAAIAATVPKSFIAFLPPPVQAEEDCEMRPKL
jgi:hypothetical protein